MFAPTNQPQPRLRQVPNAVTGFSPGWRAHEGRGRAMPLPTGVLTLLFSDIEGSTRLLERLGDDYSDVLDAHRRIVRRAISEHDGREINTAGDGFFVVFGDAANALRTAIAVQRHHASTAWPDGGVVRVRIGLHTGEPRLASGDYVGLDVHRAARICAVAHGGQVIVSEATRRALAGQVTEGIGLLELGEHWLKDLSRPLRLHQVVSDGLMSGFPPPRALARRAAQRLGGLRRSGQLHGATGRRKAADVTACDQASGS
jgi:class 3 adenylate cyclase